MASKRHRKLVEFIRRHFQHELSTPEECFLWIRGETEREIRPIASVLYAELTNVVRGLQREYEKENDGLFALMDPGDQEGLTIVKRPASIVDKMMRSHEKLEKERKKKHPGKVNVYTRDNFLDEMDDLIRFRLLCNYMSDIPKVASALVERFPKREGAALALVGREDRIRISPEKRKNGHRAVHLTFRYKGRRTLCFEVQVTTILHWGWDKKDHSLVYERTRIGEEISKRDRISIAAASDTLFLVDEYFDGLRRRMKRRRSA